MSEADILRADNSPPSQTASLLDNLPEPALRAAWFLLANSRAAQNKLHNYMTKWRHQRATISGVDLARMGIPPGPCYKQILDALRSAWIDGTVNSPEEERARLSELLAQEGRHISPS